MGPAQAIKTCLAKSFDFKGRASRSEFWWCVGPAYLILVTFLSLSYYADIQPLWEAAWSASLFFPFAGLTLFLTLGIRRSHDAGLFGIWWPVIMCLGTYPWLHLDLLLWPYESFALIIGLLLTPLFVICAGAIFLLPSEPNTNRFGPNPSEVPS